MYRRVARAMLGAAILMLAGFGGAPTNAQERAGGGAHEHGPHVACAKACAACAFQCESCHKHCVRLVAEGKKEHVRTLELCNDCGDLCALAGKIVSRQGPLQVPACEACAKACDVCVAACEKFDSDEHMKACARACKECAKACRDMIQQAGHQGGAH